jgi:hypothetical protein
VSGKVHWFAPPQPGDLVLWGRGHGIVPAAISYWTESAWSHASLVYDVAPESLYDPILVEVTKHIELRHLSRYQGERACWFLRPRLGGEQAPAREGRAVALRTVNGIGMPGNRYPVFDLLAHALDREGWSGWMRRKLISRDTDGVCSVVATAEWRREGATWWRCRGDDFAPCDPGAEGFSPAEIAQQALRGHLDTIGERPPGYARP